MANIVAVGGIIKCSHTPPGQVRLASGDGRLNVDGNNVVLQGQEVGLSFAPGSPGLITPCPVTTPTGNPSPCTATVAATTGLSSKVTVGDLGALLDSATGKAINAQDPSATWSVKSAGQNKLEADG